MASHELLQKKAPDFTLPNQDGQPVQLAELLKKGPLTVFFYPKDGTSGCTKQACAFRDAYQDFVDAGCTVVGISADGKDSHQAFRSRQNLSYPLLSDAGGQVAKAWGVKKTLGLLPGRATFVLDKTGVVRHVYVSQMSAEQHAKEALTAAQALR